MKRIMTITVMALAVASVAFGGRLYTAGNTTGTSVAPVVGGYPTIYSMSFAATNATGDLIVYEGDATEVVISAGKAASATTFIVSTCVGLDDSDVVVLQQRATGTPIEAATMSSCVETTKVMTLSAGTANAYNGTRKVDVYEMKTLTTLADVGTSDVYLSGDVFQGELRRKPIAAKLTAGTIHYMTVGGE